LSFVHEGGQRQSLVRDGMEWPLITESLSGQISYGDMIFLAEVVLGVSQVEAGAKGAHQFGGVD